MIPEKAMAKYADLVGAGMIWFAVISARVMADQAIAERARQLSRPPGAPDPVEPLQPSGPETWLTAEDYAAYAQATPAAAEEGYPTVAATDETLLDRVITETQGIDQGTLAEVAKANGQLEG